jgi:hypothetical protein
MGRPRVVTVTVARGTSLHTIVAPHQRQYFRVEWPPMRQGLVPLRLNHPCTHDWQVFGRNAADIGGSIL